MNRIKSAVEQVTVQATHAAHTVTDLVVAAKDATPVEKSAAVTTQAGAMVAIFGGLSAHEWAIAGTVAGIAVSILSLALNFYVSMRRLKLEESRSAK